MNRWQGVFSQTLENPYVAQHSGEEFKRWLASQGSADAAWETCVRGEWLVWLVQLADADRTLTVELALLCLRDGLQLLLPNWKQYGQIDDALETLTDYVRRAPYVFEDLEGFVNVRCSKIADRLMDLEEKLTGAQRNVVAAAISLMTAPGDLAAAPAAVKVIEQAFAEHGAAVEDALARTANIIRSHTQAKEEVLLYCSA